MQIKILGAGYGGVRAALDLDRWLGDREAVEITLVDANDYHQLVTELHKPAAGTAGEQAMVIPLRDIFRHTRVKLLQARVKDILPQDYQVILEGGGVLRYDRLVVALGSVPEYFNIPGVREHSLTIRSINSARTIREHLEGAFRRAAEIESADERAPYLTVVVAGGGFTGVEIAGELADRLPRLARELGLPAEEVKVVMVEALPELLQGFSPHLVEQASRTLAEKKVEVLLGVPITRMEPGAVMLQDGTRLQAQTVIWSGGVRGNPIVEKRFPTSGRGRAVVNEFLQSPAYPDVYLVGDCALALDPATGRPVAPTAQNAVEQGRVAARNIWAEYTGRPLRPYRPVNKGVVVSVGRGIGLARLGAYDLAGAGPAVLKDVITWLYIYSLGGYRLLLKYALSHLPARDGRKGPSTGRRETEAQPLGPLS